MLWGERGCPGRKPLQQSTYLGSGPNCNPCPSLNSPIPYLYSCTHPSMQTYMHTHVHMHAYTHVHTRAHIGQLQSCDHPGAPQLLWALRTALVKRSLRTRVWEARAFGSKSRPLTSILQIPGSWGHFFLGSATPICRTSPFLLI